MAETTPTISTGTGGDKILPPGSVAKSKKYDPAKRTDAERERDRIRYQEKKNKGLGSPVSVKTADKADSDPSFITETSQQVLELVDEGLATILIARARRVLHPNHLPKFEEAIGEAKWGPGEMGLVKKSVAEIAKKYDWASKYGPEVLLALLLVKHAAGQMRAFALLSRVEKEAALRTKNAATDKPGPDVKTTPVPAPAPAAVEMPGPTGAPPAPVAEAAE